MNAMKIFWAWQSNHPRRISRDVILAALEDAIEHLKQDKEISEPPEEARRNELHVDHDTKGLTGSPDIARSILDKISAATVFVGDVTPVGSTPVVHGNEGDLPGRPLMNPNVAIEYGYALGKHGDSAVIGVLNLAYGEPKDLPFDIVHKRWPITYRLVEGATKVEIDDQRKELKGKFVERIRGYIENPQPESSSFQETESVGGPAFFPGLLGAIGYSKQLNGYLNFSYRHVLYLRVIPTKRLPRPVAEKLMRDNVFKYGAMGSEDMTTMVSNDDGVAVVATVGENTEVGAITQYFANGEVWCVNADVFMQGNRGDDRWYVATTAEMVFERSLNGALDYMRNVVKAELPLKIVAGAVGLRGRKLVVSGAALNQFGKLMTDEVHHTMIMHEDTSGARKEFLDGLFDKIFDQTGNARPKS